MVSLGTSYAVPIAGNIDAGYSIRALLASWGRRLPDGKLGHGLPDGKLGHLFSHDGACWGSWA